MDTKLSNLQNGEAQFGCIKGGAWQDTFCTKKAKSIRSKEVDGFMLDKTVYCENL